MEINSLTNRTDTTPDSKLDKIYIQFGQLLSELRKKQLPDGLIAIINTSVDAINQSALIGPQLTKFVKQQQTGILKQLEKDLKIVPKNYYRNIWLPLGLSAFGLPIGVAFGVCVGNLGLLGAGLPIGMFIGIIVGISMDKKALKEGRQLDLEIKY